MIDGTLNNGRSTVQTWDNRIVITTATLNGKFVRTTYRAL